MFCLCYFSCIPEDNFATLSSCVIFEPWYQKAATYCKAELNARKSTFDRSNFIVAAAFDVKYGLVAAMLVTLNDVNQSSSTFC
jgi:hypothetical protein